MGITSVLTKENVKNKDTDIDVQESDIHVLITSASRVIAPLWPISTFAARNPWMGLENQPFDQVASWLKNTRDVDIYPSASMIRSARNKGEIDEDFVEMGLQRWLDSHSFTIPRDAAERFCHAGLKLHPLPSSLLSSHKLEKLADECSGLDHIESFYMQPISSDIETQEGERVVNILDHHVIKWSKLYLDDSQAGWTMPNREEGFYRAWQHLIQYDPALSKKQRERLKGWPQEAHVALQEALFALEIPESEIQCYLEGHLLSLPGWAGMMLWRSQQSSHEHALLTEYLAVRISMEWALIKPYLPLTNKQRSEKKISITPLLAAWIHWGGLTLEEWSQMPANEQNEYLSFAYSFDEKLRRKLWLEAWEQTHTDRLSQKIISKQRETNGKKSALAQLAFCIDVRSEPFRRQLEKEGPFETIGMAGFFGVPIATCELGSKHSHASLPIIQKPQHKVKEFVDEDVLEKYNQRTQAFHSLSHTFKTMKQNVLSSLLLPELSGPWLTLQMAARSFVPRKAGRFIRHLREAWLRKPDTKLSLHHDATEAEIPLGFTDEEKVNYARQALKMMGLTENIAPLVVICGHGSQSTNNPYAAALDCGACGGAAGGFNARVLAALCNLSEVREALLTEGMKIPEDTVFAAAEHNTTVDELHWLYVPELSEAAQEAFDHIEAVMPKVKHHANAERLAQLPNVQSKLKNPKAEAHRFAEDWSEIRPEWGLARNAAFIIGQRKLTQDCDLEGRAFLHNYDWKQDESGELLANIIAGPGTVAQWINLQYYASTVAPHYYGSGNKATQTVTAGLGVMQGNASDLLAGLPWQSVMQSDHEAYHSPLRLLIVIQAPRQHVERLLNNDPVFLQKVQNGWVRLASIDPEGCWESW
ncbi:DUF2309 domain-containing protein [Bacillus velezensis]|uniref:DUF2309 domain-containing protein n=1 Tax=Bacillus halotolerans TaxID=260554 RepID=UPI0024C193C9|nr:YbcC family protein [Bacillus halotolerans]WHY24739.1 YbcC family protein [Bacillus halotolerans]